jgi:hypothetical protein
MPTLDRDDQVALHFALGKAYGDLARYEQSFDHLKQANAIKRRQLDYDEKLMLGTLERIRTVFTPDLMKRRSGGGEESPAPLFVVGMPRSGATLVEQILARHSRIHAAGRTEALTRKLAKFRRPEIAGGDYPEMIWTMSPGDLRELGSGYLDVIGPPAPETARVVDKLPRNFMFLGLIHLALPNARIIHVRRDPLDTCFSCYSRMSAGDRPFAFDLGELGRYYRGYAALMEHWHEVLPKGVLLDVRYEELVDDLEGRARAMIAHCGLEWEEACLSLAATERPAQGASLLQARETIYRTSIGRWRNYEKFLQPLLEALKPAAASTVRELEHASI